MVMSMESELLNLCILLWLLGLAWAVMFGQGAAYLAAPQRFLKYVVRKTVRQLMHLLFVCLRVTYTWLTRVVEWFARWTAERLRRW